MLASQRGEGMLSEDFTGLAGFRAGSLLAGYRLEAQVGAGGMAVVFRARDERLGRLAALKILAPGLAADEEFRRRFTAESRAAAAVDHPHIIPVYEAGQAGGVLFIAMRFVTGGDLRGVLAREGPLPPGGRRGSCPRSHPRWTLRTGRGWSTATSSRERPGGLGPGRPEHVYLSDFGISKGAAASSAGLTGTGQFLGTRSTPHPSRPGA